ncbi:MAG: hypothetical protein ACFB11_23710 [Paracoccaceae bacterium]
MHADTAWCSGVGFYDLAACLLASQLRVSEVEEMRKVPASQWFDVKVHDVLTPFDMVEFTKGIEIGATRFMRVQHGLGVYTPRL